jgi:hypothetical protein
MKQPKQAVKIGLIANCTEDTAQGFLSAIRDREFPGAECVSDLRNSTCPKCIHDLITSNRLTLLFLDKDVEIAGVDCSEVSEVLGIIKHDTRAEIYIVGQAS